MDCRRGGLGICPSCDRSESCPRDGRSDRRRLTSTRLWLDDDAWSFDRRRDLLPTRVATRGRQRLVSRIGALDRRRRATWSKALLHRPKVERTRWLLDPRETLDGASVYRGWVGRLRSDPRWDRRDTRLDTPAKSGSSFVARRDRASVFYRTCVRSDRLLDEWMLLRRCRRIGFAFDRVSSRRAGLHGPTRLGPTFGNSYQVDPWTRLDDRCGRSGKLGSASWHHAGPNPRFDPSWAGAARPPVASPSHARARPTGARRPGPHRPSSYRGKGTTQSKFAGSPIANLCFNHRVFALFLELDDPAMGPASGAGLRFRLARLRGASFSRRDCSGRRRGTVRYRAEYRPMGQHRRYPLRRDPDGILMVRIV